MKIINWFKNKISSKHKQLKLEIEALKGELKEKEEVIENLSFESDDRIRLLETHILVDALKVYWLQLELHRKDDLIKNQKSKDALEINSLKQEVQINDDFIRLLQRQIDDKVMEYDVQVEMLKQKSREIEDKYILLIEERNGLRETLRSNDEQIRKTCHDIILEKTGIDADHFNYESFRNYSAQIRLFSDLLDLDANINLYDEYSYKIRSIESWSYEKGLIVFGDMITKDGERIGDLIVVEDKPGSICGQIHGNHEMLIEHLVDKEKVSMNSFMKEILKKHIQSDISIRMRHIDNSNYHDEFRVEILNGDFVIDEVCLSSDVQITDESLANRIGSTNITSESISEAIEDVVKRIEKYKELKNRAVELSVVDFS